MDGARKKGKEGKPKVDGKRWIKGNIKIGKT